MQLSYRGIKYESNESTIAAIPGEVIGKYRGTEFRNTRYSQPEAKSTVILQYRGTLYVKS